MTEKLKDIILVIGLGSPIMCDDAVGLRIAEEIENMKIPDVETRQEAIGGLEILTVVRGYRYVIVADCIQTGSVEPGTVMIFDLEDFDSTVVPASAHDFNLATAFAIGRDVEPDTMPEMVKYVAVEAADIQTLSETMTPAVEAAVPSAVSAVLHIAEQFRSF
ncbi:MAG: hydrogenase maturation protease [Candidatus Methanomethylophilaceae archaeon]|jgi:hydrogenase maturation protease